MPPMLGQAEIYQHCHRTSGDLGHCRVHRTESTTTAAISASRTNAAPVVSAISAQVQIPCIGASGRFCKLQSTSVSWGHIELTEPEIFWLQEFFAQN